MSSVEFHFSNFVSDARSCSCKAEQLNKCVFPVHVGFLPDSSIHILRFHDACYLRCRLPMSRCCLYTYLLMSIL